MKYHTLQQQYYFQSVPREIFNHLSTTLQEKTTFYYYAAKLEHSLKNSCVGRSTSGTASSIWVSKITICLHSNTNHLVWLSNILAIYCNNHNTQMLCWQNVESVNVTEPHAAEPVLWSIKCNPTGETVHPLSWISTLYLQSGEVRNQHNIAKLNFVDRDNAQHDRLTNVKATDANLDLNLVSVWGMKQVVDFKASL